MFLVYDSETTSKANFKLPASHPSQPHLVQLGLQVLNNDLIAVHQFDAIVKPEGWVIPPEASIIHGITQDKALAVGVPLKFVLGAFVEFANICECRVAHNIQFDDLVVGAALHRTNTKFGEGMSRFCTMRSMTDIMKLPGLYGPKWPKLCEAYKYCTGNELEGAHDALHDVRGCAEIFRWLRQRQPATVAA